MADKRTYELMFIVDPTAGDEDVVKLSEGVQKIITGQGGSITKTEMMGKRKLAYPIAKSEHAIYVFYTVEVPALNVRKVERELNIAGQKQDYMYFRLTGVKLNVQLWYDAKKRLVREELVEDGHTMGPHDQLRNDLPVRQLDLGCGNEFVRQSLREGGQLAARRPGHGQAFEDAPDTGQPDDHQRARRDESKRPRQYARQRLGYPWARGHQALGE